MPGRLSLLAALALVAACQEREPAAGAAAGGSASASQAPDPLSVRPTGVGPLGEGTPFDKAAIEGALPGATVEPAFVNFRREETTPVLNVSAGGTQTLQIAGDAAGRIGSITVTGGDYEAPDGERLLARWSELRFQPDDCVMGDGPTLHALVCRKAGVPQIDYVFAIPGWTSSETPSAQVLADRAFIREMVWTAGAPAP
jgi:hypothetical protein